jgi:hypothetical protein
MNHLRIPTTTLRSRALLILGLAVLIAVPARADLKSDLAFTAFAGTDVDVNALAGGNILQARGPIMTFARGITSQSLFFVNAAPADVAAKLTHWNPATHKDLEVWLHQSLPPNPTAANFANLATLPDNKSVQFQIDATSSPDPAKSLQLSKEEAQIIAATAAQEKDPKALFVKAWSQILTGRINDFFSGKAAADYDVAGEGDVHPLSDVKSLLHSDLKVYSNYQKLLNQTPVKALAGGSAVRINPSDVYCDVFDVQGSAAMGTGAIFQAPSGSAIQSADVEFYTNYGVYATIELEQMWPINANGKNGTLVWREDLVSAPNIAYLHGTERLASSMIMLQETKGGVQAFMDEFK